MSGVSSPRLIYGMQWCASNHPVGISEQSGYLWCTLCVSHTLQSALESEHEARIVQIATIREFSISSVLLILEVLCCLYWHSSYQIDHSTLSWMIVEVNWLTWCQKCRMAAFWARYCSYDTPRSFFPFWIISWPVMPMTPLWWLLCHPQALESPFSLTSSLTMYSSASTWKMFTLLWQHECSKPLVLLLLLYYTRCK